MYAAAAAEQPAHPGQLPSGTRCESSWQRCHAETTVHHMTRGVANATQLHAASLSSQPPWPTDIKGGGVGMASSTATANEDRGEREREGCE